jgi:hypothetical protein
MSQRIIYHHSLGFPASAVLVDHQNCTKRQWQNLTAKMMTRLEFVRMKKLQDKT